MPLELISTIAWWMVAATALLAGASKTCGIVYDELAHNFGQQHRLGQYAPPQQASKQKAESSEGDEEKSEPPSENTQHMFWKLSSRARIGNKLAGMFGSGFGMAITVLIVIALINWLN